MPQEIKINRHQYYIKHFYINNTLFFNEKLKLEYYLSHPKKYINKKDNYNLMYHVIENNEYTNDPNFKEKAIYKVNDRKQRVIEVCFIGESPNCLEDIKNKLETVVVKDDLEYMLYNQWIQELKDKKRKLQFTKKTTRRKPLIDTIKRLERETEILMINILYKISKKYTNEESVHLKENRL